jgi:UDP-N-acetylmuramoyl-tripeptide--D-alanyl-D-alanine ligase
MPEYHIDEIARVMRGTTAVPGGKGKGAQSPRFAHYRFDTRQISEPGTLFFALKSESSDGHRFVRQLTNIPGTGAVVANDFDAAGIEIPLIRVADPLAAAQALAAHVRNTHRNIKYIGVTGSAGKTTTKEFIYQLLSHKYRAYRSFKNWNNWIGVPFCLLNMTGEEEAAVFELAMSYPGIGEIDLLANILRPDAAVILNAYPVHLEFLKTVENVAKAKSEILNHLAADDAAFINGDCEPVMNVVSGPDAPKGRKIYFGKTAPHNHIRLRDITRDDGNTTMIVDFYGMDARFVTPLINRLHIENLVAAIAVAHHLGMKHVEIQEALPGVTPMSDRGQVRHYANGDFTVIDETYNSNPEALKQTLAWVDREYGDKLKKGAEKIAVVGDMLELGEHEEQFHRQVGEFFAGLEFHRLVAVGERAAHIAEGAAQKGFDRDRIHVFDDAAAAGKFLEQTAKQGSVLLFKASRGIRLEQAVEEFLK